MTDDLINDELNNRERGQLNKRDEFDKV